MKIYVVTDGEYSDYHICGIYFTKKKAKDAKNFWMARNDIEEHETGKLPEHPDGCVLFKIIMNKDGSVFDVAQVSPYYCSNDFVYEPSGHGDMVFKVWAIDEQGAINNVEVLRVELLAKNKWEDDWEKWRESGADKTAPCLSFSSGGQL